MLFLFLLLQLYSVYASPTSSQGSGSAPDVCSDINDCRTLWDIIWNCTATIFLCTWVSLHPNIPEPQNEATIVKELRIFFTERVPLFLCALLVPEYILAWAIRQRFVAGDLAKENKALGITITHGFFIVMGGFHVFEEADETENEEIPQEGEHDDEEAPLLDRKPTAQLRNYPLDKWGVLEEIKQKRIRLPLEAEILDRSKSDWLAKAIVVLQSFWFIVQCVARGVQHLPLTGLEVITLAYTVLNFGISIAWWYKPRDITRPIRVFRKPGNSSKYNPPGFKWTRIFSFVAGTQDKDVKLEELTQIPTFYSGEPEAKQVLIADLSTLLLGIVFGLIHCIAWSYQFPSHAAMIIWRICSIAIAVVPVVIFALATPFTSRRFNNWNQEEASPALIMGSYTVVFALGGIIYVVARIITVVLAFVSLDSLPSAAYREVEWLDFIPRLRIHPGTSG